MIHYTLYIILYTYIYMHIVHTTLHVNSISTMKKEPYDTDRIVRDPVKVLYSLVYLAQAL